MLADYPDDTEIYIDMLTDDKYENDNIWTTDVRNPYDIRKLRWVADNKQAQRAHKDNGHGKKCVVL